MKYITVTPPQRKLLDALYDKKDMRYLVHDRIGDAAVYARKPELDETTGFWSVPGLYLNEVEYLTEESINDLCDEMGIKLPGSPFPFCWLSEEDGPVAIGSLLELSKATGVTTMEAVKEDDNKPSRPIQVHMEHIKWTNTISNLLQQIEEKG